MTQWGPAATTVVLVLESHRVFEDEDEKILLRKQDSKLLQCRFLFGGIVAAARLHQGFVAAEQVLLFSSDYRRAEACEGGFQLRNPR
jgi:hypothetical protein